MVIYDSIEPFGFAMAVLGSTRIPNTINNLAMNVLKCILTPLFISVEMFSLVVTYIFMFD